MIAEKTARKMNNYLFMPRSANGGRRYSDNSANDKPRQPKPGLLYQMQDFLQNNILAWFIHDWHVKKRYNYPTVAPDSIHTVPDSPSPVSICLAGDWASSTPQSRFVGEKMQELSPDYTIHLGDTYYSGTAAELADNFGRGGVDTGDWPRGRLGCFALAGNHEMYSSGADFLAMIGDPGRGFGAKDPASSMSKGQEAPFFCLELKHWNIIGLDTAYDSLVKSFWQRIFSIHKDDTGMQLPDLLMGWLRANPKILDAKKGIVLVSHHQYASAFTGEDEFTGPAAQLKEMLGDRPVLWIWGHEHRFAVYNKYSASDGKHITAYGRCIGHGGMVDEHRDDRKADPAKARSRGLELYDHRTADSFHFDDETIQVGYNGFAAMKIEGTSLTVTYYASYWNGNDNMVKISDAIFQEQWGLDSLGGVQRLNKKELIPDLTH